ncbi:MAG TPA: anti-sigma factor [Acetobacteraceae bacterium]|nr:anti-sigma factor [Acetobacteraceae bacterium]
MSGTPHPDIPEELQVLAGEYVLGALDAAEMRAVRRRAAVDPLLAAAITGWERRLSPLAEVVAPKTPPAALWSRIEAAVAALPEEAAEPPSLHAPAERLVPPARPPHPPRAVRPRRVWPWQLATAASLALAAGLAAFALLPRQAPPIEVAALTPPNAAAPGFVAEARPDGSVVLTALAPQPVPADRDMELWILPRGQTAPSSLGVLPAKGTRVVLPTAPAPGTQIMVSLEPKGGSKTGAPTGPVLYAGSFGPQPL